MQSARAFLLTPLGAQGVPGRTGPAENIPAPACGGHRGPLWEGSGTGPGGRGRHTHQQRVQLSRVVGEEPGRLLAQLAYLGDLVEGKRRG